MLQVSVRNGEQLLLDTVTWDISQPYNTAEQYASCLCQGLGLRYNWFVAIVTQVRQLLSDVQEVRCIVDLCLSALVSGLRHCCLCLLLASFPAVVCSM